MVSATRFVWLGVLTWAAAVVGPQPRPAVRAAEVEPARFHHVRLNVTDPAETIRFYRRVFGAVPVKYRGRVDGLFTERSFILLNPVDAPPDPTLNTGIWHIGWGGVDVKNEHEWWKSHGVTIHTPLSPLPGRDNYYMYIAGPDRELIEINTMGHHRFAHVHLFADDVNAATAWYADHLGAKPRSREVPRPTGDINTLGGIWMNSFQIDNVTFIIFGKPDQEPKPIWWPDPPLQEIQPTKGRPINHLAFSYRELAPALARMESAGVKIVEPIAVREPFGFESFFVEGPHGVLIEIVAEKPIPEGIWEP